ncbi:phenylalanine ammonium lyase [Gloeophyllum trabeum ATCC 11539]|uniref:Phenylalanine ammonium lyase n=1 Tax=Gloeophyllum trabeum (strain ATCC 11539 / FP-39264 / Madison 617) TaxID=670483 RepID=S7Q6L1_GLOTA|nr:phenylalanine ammonium lyase [Gloeophyllum trabeum ATCC 11539]EPQ55063.1 phenylalanine ammonium lyase [Gloeophyllum trabeum ATCC 11539]
MNGHSANGHANGRATNGHASPVKDSGLLPKFIDAVHELEYYRNGKPVKLDGHSLSIPAVVAAARFNSPVTLDYSPEVQDRVAKSRDVIVEKVNGLKSVYGVSTGFGGSADTRTSNTLALGHALLQHQHSGVLPSSTKASSALPLSDPLTSTSMPEAWVRGAILIRINSLIRGHSGVRWELIEKMVDLLREDIVPLVPLRGSISASGDLAPLSYIAGTLTANPSIRVFDGPRASGQRVIKSSRDALREHKIEPVALQSKEHLGILNGTAFSASVGALALSEAAHLALLAQVCTAMGVEALAGTRGSFDPFIHDVARPHPGQVESARMIHDLLEGSTFAITAEEEVTISEDKGHLRQDRYPLRTAPQFLGPQIEDILSALETVTLECNSTTDNPLVDGNTGTVHHGGNFQAMAVSNAMEKTRLALHHIGKILFAQSTELMNPTMNRGLPPNLASTDPSLNYHTKGIDIATAAYVGELGYLANPVSTHVQSAEMHNQAVNSLALISARATINALEVLSMLISSYLYCLCQALDLRAMQAEFMEGVSKIVREELSTAFGSSLEGSSLEGLSSQIFSVVVDAFEETSSMDAAPRMQHIAAQTTTALFDFLSSPAPQALASIPSFRDSLAKRSTDLLKQLRQDYLSGTRGPAPAIPYLSRTRPVYEFIRVKLGVRMHGSENLHLWENGAGVEDVTIGQNISSIYEAIRDGQMQEVVVGLFN